MASLVDQMKGYYKRGSILLKLIYINVGVFLLINLGLLACYLFKIDFSYTLGGNLFSGFQVFKPTYWLAVNSNLMETIMQPWSIITYMFLHEDFFHIFFNMLVLFFAGGLFLHFLGSRRLLTTYLLGGIAGAVLYLLAYNIFPVFKAYSDLKVPMLGASASVMAVFFGITAYNPNYPVRLFLLPVQVRLWHIAAFYFIIDLISIKSSNPGGHIAHIGGALWGYLSVWQMQKGRDISKGFERFIFSFPSLFKRKPKMKVTYKNTEKRKVSDEEYNANKVDQQKRIDAILDKISKSGYESLSKEEKAFLFKASKEN